MKERKVARNSIDGQFVEKEYAKENPHTTQVETIKYPEAKDDTETHEADVPHGRED